MLIYRRGERGVKKTIIYILVVTIIPCTVYPAQQQLDDQEDAQESVQETVQEQRSYLLDIPNGKPFETLNHEKVHGYFRHFIVDTVNIWSFVFSLDTMNLLLAIIPTYLIAQHEDNRVHRQFYDCATHTNKNQPKGFPKAIVIDDGFIALPLIALGSLGWFSTSAYTRRQCQVFVSGLVWAWLTKVVFKTIVKVDGCLRPWNEEYSANYQSYGGNPSGHLTSLSFLTTYWAFQWGLPWALPMGALTLYSMAINVAVNHHYLSQVVAGASLGLVFGVAAHSAFDFVKKTDNIVVGFDATGGKPGIKLTYSF